MDGLPGAGSTGFPLRDDLRPNQGLQYFPRLARPRPAESHETPRAPGMTRNGVAGAGTDVWQAYFAPELFCIVDHYGNQHSLTPTASTVSALWVDRVHSHDWPNDEKAKVLGGQNYRPHNVSKIQGQTALLLQK
ncbi:hypothetical protein PCH_Pc22g25610 [Penicillium rubens Wisconsin 54-1255]|uniref:Uncharacterized protein n=1 Tax=Penicillium rubens (strain ATCC 28089 / DSM 1075 / NRRL 1951 / Wisconsin 54-1255) TaxID=500485 RepID=B6HSJ9_PENRW|nr:hypothetical protein PCH_Pc22g25610 [Penicillium rubens Wisconsin 54-1255]